MLKLHSIVRVRDAFDANLPAIVRAAADSVDDLGQVAQSPAAAAEWVAATTRAVVAAVGDVMVQNFGLTAGQVLRVVERVMTNAARDLARCVPHRVPAADYLAHFLPDLVRDLLLDRVQTLPPPRNGRAGKRLARLASDLRGMLQFRLDDLARSAIDGFAAGRVVAASESDVWELAAAVNVSVGGPTVDAVAIARAGLSSGLSHVLALAAVRHGTVESFTNGIDEREIVAAFVRRVRHVVMSMVEDQLPPTF